MSLSDHGTALATERVCGLCSVMVVVKVVADFPSCGGLVVGFFFGDVTS